jgi:hypothetical protein
MEHNLRTLLNTLILILLTSTVVGCSIEATIEPVIDIVTHETHRLTPDIQYGEVAKSGHYSIEAQIGEIAEKKVSGSYVIEGVIAYE